MAGRLKVICTPIGNLGDLSPRAKDALSTAPLILAEDTRHSRPLVVAAGANLDKTKLLSCHQHNENDRIEVVMQRLVAGDDVALISDAGAPGISDPGSRLVDAVCQAGHDVEVLPGPSAVIAALMGSGLRASRYVFLGFVPKKGKARRDLFIQAAASGFAVVLFESPLRMDQTLKDLHGHFGPRRVVVARELTKAHETFHRGRLGEGIFPPLVEKGEAVVVVEAGEGAPLLSDEIDIAERAALLASDPDLTPKEAARKLAEATGLSSKDAYARVVEAKKKP
jgi:16S rRNA (cytidine1402-2'-O)-methyltransferase